MRFHEHSITQLAALTASDPRAVQHRLGSPDYWLGLVQSASAGMDLTIAEVDRSTAWGPGAARHPGAHEQPGLRGDMAREGWAAVPGFLDARRSASLATASLALLEHGWPATFLLVFDQAWQVGRHLGRLMQSLANDRVALRYEMFVYCVDSTRPLARARGIEPHRDAPHVGFDERGGERLPRHCTSWLALTETTVDNGCIYVVPTHRDPDASAPIREEAGIPLEVPAGTALLWGGHVAHWGGVHDPVRARGPRVAITCVASVEPMWGLPALDLPTEIGASALPSLETRLRFVCALLRGFGPLRPGTPAAVITDALWPGPRRRPAPAVELAAPLPA